MASQHTLRILPLGDPPPFRQEVRNGLRYEIPAAEGTIPPRQLEILTGGEGGQPLPLRLRLGMPTEPLMLTLPESGALETRQPSGPWARIPLSKSRGTLALVWRRGKDWSRAGVLAVPDGPEDRGRGDCRFINVTGQAMGIVWGKERLKLAPRTTLMRSLPSGTEDIEVSILYPASDGSLQPCLSTRYSRRAGRLQQYVIYAADEMQPRIPVKVLPMDEAR